jgi:DNA repair exonuclease SbcCD ATPase subunit
LRVSPTPPNDWLATQFPGEQDLEEARSRVERWALESRDYEHLRELLSRRNHLVREIQELEQKRDSLIARLPADPSAILREFNLVDAEIKLVNKQLPGQRELARGVQQDCDRLSAQMSTIRERVIEFRGWLQTEETSRKHIMSAIAAAHKSLPTHWQSQSDMFGLAEIHRLKGECDDLERNGSEARAEELQSARIEIESLKHLIGESERECERFPDLVRRDPSSLEPECDQAKAEVEAKSRAASAAENALALLEQRSAARDHVAVQLAAAQQDWSRLKILSDLLGRDRLQRHMVRQAERRIVEFTNVVLDRLSQGELMLRLVASDSGAEEALDLEAFNRSAADAAINVNFLSGSQRFRVAVGLALGIGQFASRLHRPIESVIIDEGFGSLDRNGRQVMIQELQNLRGSMKCILLVSHQEEFADAFSDGYRFELVDGATRVSRYQR